MVKKQRPSSETQAVLTRISKDAFRKLKEEAVQAKRSVGMQAALILEQHCLTAIWQDNANRQPGPRQESKEQVPA